MCWRTVILVLIPIISDIIVNNNNTISDIIVNNNNNTNLQVLQLDVLEEGQSKDPLADASNNQMR